MPPLSRRHFLKSAAALGACASIGVRPALARSLKPSAGYRFPLSEPGWIEKSMRWANLTLVEIDPPRFDPDYWLDLFKKCRVDAACLSAGGYIAYYPSQIPLHYVSKSMKPGDDPFGYLVEGCRKLGIVVTGRLDSHAVHDDVRQAHPDWIAVGPDGQARRHWLYPEAWVTCCYGPYSFDYTPRIVEEVERLYHVDGIFINRWDNTGACFCDHCRRQFKADTGLELTLSGTAMGAAPGTGTTNVAMKELPEGHPARRAWKAWRDERMLKVWDLWDGPIRKLNPNARCIPNGVTMFDVDEVRRRADYLSLDKQGRGESKDGTPIWTIGLDAKKGRSLIGWRKPLVAGFAFGPMNEFRNKTSVHGRYGEAYLWAIEALANGLRPSIGITNAMLDDTRWISETVELFSWIEKHQGYLRERMPLARVALVQNPFGANDEPARLGMYQALLEARLPFEVLHIRDVGEEEVTRRFKVLILPNLTRLSDAQCAQLTRYAEAGGGLVATYQTSTLDGAGKRRDTFGLANIFGADATGVQGPMHNCFMRLEREKGGGRHPLLEGYDGADVIVNTSHRVELKLRRPLESMPLTLIPSYPSLPMEEIYPRQPRTEIPQVIVRKVGRGRVVYFPGNLDAFFHERLIQDHGRLIGNAVRWAMAEPAMVEIDGPGLYDVTAWRQEGSLTVHLVNLNNPMAMSGYIREFIPSPPLGVRVRLPEGIKAGTVKLLVSGKDPAAKVAGGLVTLTVPAMLAHEVIAIEG